MWRIFLRTVIRIFRIPIMKVTPLPKGISVENRYGKFFEAISELWKYAIRFKKKHYFEIIYDVQKVLEKDYIILKNQKQVESFLLAIEVLLSS